MYLSDPFRDKSKDGLSQIEDPNLSKVSQFYIQPQSTMRWVFSGLYIDIKAISARRNNLLDSPAAWGSLTQTNLRPNAVV